MDSINSIFAKNMYATCPTLKLNGNKNFFKKNSEQKVNTDISDSIDLLYKDTNKSFFKQNNNDIGAQFTYTPIGMKKITYGRFVF